ncbi:MAG: rhodanese-like domain-containing protein [Spongiibacteraceae bacterium]
MSNAALKNQNEFHGIEIDAASILERARARNADDSGYAGGVTPEEAWHLFSTEQAVLIDVRTSEERKFVGHVPNTQHVAWATGTSMTRNPRFARELETKLKKDQIVLFLCRSGKRSAEAARAAAKAGFTNAFNVLEGFEGEIDDNGQRGHLGGWRSHRLPWVQD